MDNLFIASFDMSLLNECMDLYQDVFSREPWFEDSTREAVERYFLNMYQMNKFVGYVIKDKNKVIAFSLGFLKPWIKGEEYYIDQFCVAFEYQGKGVGTYFMDEIKKSLADRGIHVIVLTTEKEFPSFKFYIMNGFESFEDMRFLGCDF